VQHRNLGSWVAERMERAGLGMIRKVRERKE
jgi:hypothetical protein